ncbi:MAG: ATP-binding protein [bacterium]|nr:ATP-binding protein [bacterium]
MSIPKRNGTKLIDDFRTIAQKFLHMAHQGTPRVDFLREVAGIFINFSGCDEVAVWTEEQKTWFQCAVGKEDPNEFKFTIRKVKSTQFGMDFHGSALSEIEKLAFWVVYKKISPGCGHFTSNDSLLIKGAAKPVRIVFQAGDHLENVDLRLSVQYNTILIIPFVINGDNRGMLLFACRTAHHLSETEIKFYEGLTAILGASISTRRNQVALRERVKELTCLHGIVRLIERPGISIEEIMQGILELIPPAWLYPDIAACRIILNGRIYATHNFNESAEKLLAPIIARDIKQGSIEVVYTDERRELDEGPFLKEERSLLNAIAREISNILEQRMAEEEKSKLEDQLRHADRLATIGQLAAGVAHEINEPLGNILGFAQLANKSPGLSPEVGADLQKIINASLHAREVIKKLMVFSRQSPAQETWVDLNSIVNEGLYFFEARCVKAGIQLIRNLEDDLPEISVDPALLNQVLVNLVVNSIQAMPDGGELTVYTRSDQDSVYLIVDDTGAGMSEKVQEQIFLPFFTTKDIDEGTGLGLAVVHGIVTSRRGTIKVESEVGKGARFIIRLPRNGKTGQKEISANEQETR